MILDTPVIIADSVLGIVPRVVLAILRIVAAKICAAISSYNAEFKLRFAVNHFFFTMQRFLKNEIP